MTQQRSFVRKIVYLLAMAVLLIVLVWLGQPATIGVGTEKGSPGGMLAQLRRSTTSARPSWATSIRPARR